VDALKERGRLGCAEGQVDAWRQVVHLSGGDGDSDGLLCDAVNDEQVQPDAGLGLGRRSCREQLAFVLGRVLCA
jgi:hypothetical protein